MALTRLYKRVQSLEVAYPRPLTVAEQEEAEEAYCKSHTLVVFRHTWESREEALARWEVEESEWGHVSVLVWPVERPAPKPMVRPKPGEMCLVLQEHERVLQEAHARLEAQRRAQGGESGEGG